MTKTTETRLSKKVLRESAIEQSVARLELNPRFHMLPKAKQEYMRKETRRIMTEFWKDFRDEDES